MAIALVLRAASSFRVGNRRQARGTETRPKKRVGQKCAPRGSCGALTLGGAALDPGTDFGHVALVSRVVMVLGTVVAGAGVIFGCGTAAPESGGDKNLPNAKAGPFRVLRDGEMDPRERVVPYGIRTKGTRDPSVIQSYEGPSPLGVDLYLAAPDPTDVEGPTDRILLFRAEDGRSFPRQETASVLEPSETWEGGTVGAPSVLRVGDTIRLYYAAAGGIGMATSSDGVHFAKHGSPVLQAPGGDSWEEQWIPSEPSVVQVGELDFRMFYVAGRGIGEARSHDGEKWDRVSDSPALWPVPPPDFPTPEQDNVYEPFDDAAVAGPYATMGTSSLGRSILRVYYTGLNRIGLWSLGLAARYQGTLRLNRADGPVLSNLFTPQGPAVLFFPDFTLLYFTAPSDERKPESDKAIAVGVAPATISLDLGL